MARVLPATTLAANPLRLLSGGSTTARLSTRRSFLKPKITIESRDDQNLVFPSPRPRAQNFLPLQSGGPQGCIFNSLKGNKRKGIEYTGHLNELSCRNGGNYDDNEIDLLRKRIGE